uniref:hypothetical protein n=1 Tax=Ralstonia pseudosolanacearum TaxID=1310165 RepID=UPI001FFABB55
PQFLADSSSRHAPHDTVCLAPCPVVLAALNPTLRNAEHYLYAYNSVSSGEYSVGTMTVLSIGYSVIKEVRNRLNEGDSPYRGSPPSVDEVEAGIQGAVDGAVDDGEECGCYKN